MTLDFEPSLLSGGVFVAAASAVLALVWVRLPWRAATWLLTAGVPLVIASLVYWLPAWLGENSSEYLHWAPVFIVPWYAVATLASCLVVAIDSRRRRRQQR
jgi:hypothetical protein